MAPPITRNATNRRYQGRAGSLPTFISVSSFLHCHLLRRSRRRLRIFLTNLESRFDCERDDFRLHRVGIRSFWRLSSRRRLRSSNCFHSFTVRLDVEIAEQAVRELQTLTKLSH